MEMLNNTRPLKQTYHFYILNFMLTTGPIEERSNSFSRLVPAVITGAGRQLAAAGLSSFVAAAEAGILEFDRKNFGGQPLLWDLVKDVRLAQQEQAGEGGGPGGPTNKPSRPPNSEETYRTVRANLLRGGGAEAGQLFLTQEEAFVDRGTLALDRPTTAEGPPPTTELLHRLVDEDQLASGCNAFAGSEHRFLGQGSAAIGPGLQLLYGASGSLGGASSMAVRDHQRWY
eukprot:g13235.t1